MKLISRTMPHPERACEPLLGSDGIGKAWVFGQFQVSEKDWCLAAYEFAERCDDGVLNH